MTNKTTYYCITGVSRLSGEREELTVPMEKEKAQALLERYKENTRYQKYPTYTRVRVEPLLPVQLRLPFESNKNSELWKRKSCKKSSSSPRGGR